MPVRGMDVGLLKVANQVEGRSCNSHDGIVGIVQDTSLVLF